MQDFLAPHGLVLTGNSMTIYAISFLDLKGTVREGYYTVTSRTTLAAYFARGIVRNGDVAGVAWAMNQAISMAPDLKDVVYYPGTHWEFVLMCKSRPATRILARS
jgi:hypothetical protein